jgi:hypothetical protein
MPDVDTGLDEAAERDVAGALFGATGTSVQVQTRTRDESEDREPVHSDPASIPGQPRLW